MQIFTFQLGEIVTKFYVVKYFWILIKLPKVVVKYLKIFLVGMILFLLQSNFEAEKKPEKWQFFRLAANILYGFDCILLVQPKGA